MRPVERAFSQVVSGEVHKNYKCHPNQKGHTIGECIEFKNVVCYLLYMDSIANSWGDGIVIACDEPRLDIPVIKTTKFFRCPFTPFKKKWWRST